MRLFRPILFPLALLGGACTTPTPPAADAVLDGLDAVAIIEESITDRVDVPNVDRPSTPTDTGVCPMGTVVCGILGCIDLQTDSTHCGACGMECPEVGDGTARCVMGVCAPTCNAGFEQVGPSCLAVGSFPRPIAPISLGDVTLRRPTLRWQLPTGADGAVVDLCLDRACTMVIESLRAMGTSGRPTRPLPANSVVFWRLRAAVGMGTSMSFSPTWFFHVPAMDNSNAIDTSANPHLDLNGDGFDDLVVGAPSASPDIRGMFGTASVYYGSVMGIAAAPARVLEGVGVGDKFGGSVASAGDVNGDGFGDLVVGAVEAAPGGRRYAGTASVYHGSVTGISAAPARVLEGNVANLQFGGSVSSVGDVNADGYADLVVGNAYASPGGRVRAGTASVYYGSMMGITADPARVLEGVAAGNNFGWSVASAGDVNGDGYSDLVVGAQLGDGPARFSAGTASVYHGSAAGISMVPARVLEGDVAGDIFGVSVSSAGDVNGDGYSDLVVGAFLASGMIPNGGTASVFHGGAMGVPMVAARVLEADRNSRNFGWSVSRAGDVNGDGYADLVIGAYGGFGGTASVFHGSETGIPMRPTRVLEGTAREDSFGWSVSGAGDVNGDGFADLVVGAVQADPGDRINAGTASVFHGSAIGVPMVAVRVLEGVAANDRFGYSVASLVHRTHGGRNQSVASIWLERLFMRGMKRG